MEKPDDIKFSKKAIVESKTYEVAKDYLAGNLEEGKRYTKKEINELLKKGGFEC